MTFGFANSHSVLITYQSCSDSEEAAHVAAELASLRSEAIEYWQDGTDSSGEPYPSETAQP